MKLLILISLVLASCSTSPTGRRQMTIMPEGQLASMGAQSFEELKKKTPIEKDPRINAYVKCITDPILKATGPVEGVSSWEVVVFKDKQVNAFALPGGKIGVYTGIIKIATTPDQLAAVLGHEVGHVMAKHGNERVSQGMASQIALAGTAIALGKDGKLDKKSQMIVAGLGVGMQFGVLLPFSRTHESEADVIGLELMSKAGFNPEDSVQLWKNMAKASGGKQPPQWMSTHPSNQTRIDNLTKNIPKYAPYYQKIVQKGDAPECSLNGASL
jgi:predicted Zn-dependent protease